MLYIELFNNLFTPYYFSYTSNKFRQQLSTIIILLIES